jgi:hypothetical protein
LSIYNAIAQILKSFFEKKYFPCGDHWMEIFKKQILSQRPNSVFNGDFFPLSFKQKLTSRKIKPVPAACLPEPVGV